jgi:multidrug efflux pump subunit AcrA (membrane-fusion protein)
VSFNQNALAQIVAPVGGILQSVDADWGARVDEGQVVARLWSAAVAEAVAKAVLTHQTLERERKLSADRVTSQATLRRPRRRTMPPVCPCEPWGSPKNALRNSATSR